MQQDEERQALEDFEEALRLDPNNAEILTGLGMVHARKLDFDQALDAYERAMSLDAENARTYYNAACAAALSEREEQALAWLERAIELRSRYRIMARQDPDFSFIRDHPAFQRLTTASDV
jgi:Flp pilus assembly protein TadD